MQPIELLQNLLEADLPLQTQMDILLTITTTGINGQALARMVEYLYTAAGHPQPVHSALDIVGTGGDGQHLFNISTASSFVIAGAGVPVLKHGNSSVSSRSGSIDCLKALDIALPQSRAEALTQFEQVGLSFLFAPQFYPILQQVKPARQVLAQQGQLSIFNLLGPLLNPLRPSHQLIGVVKTEWVRPIAEALFLLGREGLVFCCAGTDELIPHPQSHIMQVNSSGCEILKFDYQAQGFREISLNQLKGGNPTENAAMLLELLHNRLSSPLQTVVLLNAAFAIAVFQDLPFQEAYAQAKHSLTSGQALAKLKALQEQTP